MWNYEHSVETTGTPQDVWARYADITTWREWDAGIDEIVPHGPFAVGTVVTMTPAGQDPVEMTIVEATAPERFVDETVVGEVTLRFIHELTPTATGTRITHRVEIDGPGAEHIGPAVTDDLPEAMAALAKLTSR